LTRVRWRFWSANTTMNTATTNATMSRVWFCLLGGRLGGWSPMRAPFRRRSTLARGACRSRGRRVLLPVARHQPADAVPHGPVGERKVRLARGDEAEAAGRHG